MDKTKKPRFAKRKTDLWWVYSNGGDWLGMIQWYAPWRQYCFDSVPKGTVLAKSCLRDLADFCDQETKKYKSKNHCSTSKDTVDSDKVRCLLLEPEIDGHKDCIRTGIEPNPSETQCEGCSFALYGANLVESINKHRKRS